MMTLRHLDKLLNSLSSAGDKVLLSEIPALKNLLVREGVGSNGDDDGGIVGQVPPAQPVPDSQDLEHDIVKHFGDKDYLKVVSLLCDSMIGTKSLKIWDCFVDSLEALGFGNIAGKYLTEAIALEGREGGIDVETIGILREKLDGLRIKSIYGPLTTNIPVEMRKTETKGKGVYSKKVIIKGHAIFSDIPLMCAPNLDNASPETYCSLCSKSVLTCEYHFRSSWTSMTKSEKNMIQQNWPKIRKIPCDFCTWEYYCSDTCKIQAWDKFHKFICPSKYQNTLKLYELCSSSYQTLDKGLWNAMFSPMLIVKLLLSKLTSDKVSTATQLYQDVGVELKTFCSPSTAQKVETFFTPIHQLVMAALEPWLKVASDCGEDVSSLMDAFLTIYYKCATNVQSFNSPSYNSTTYQIFEKNLSTNPNEYSRLAKYFATIEPVKDQTFCGLFLLHSCLNHDCRPNAQVEDLRDGRTDRIGVTVRALRQIEVGEEVTIPYIDTSMPKWIRQAWLRRSYNFKCQCDGCKYEGTTKSVCSNCSNDNTVDSLKLKSCGRCLRAWYCSKECQVEHWKAGHKNICVEKKASDPLIPFDTINDILSNSNIKLTL